MNDILSERAIIFAPFGRDAGIAAAMLFEAAIKSTAACSHNEFIEALINGAGLALVTEEALRGADLHPLDTFLRGQEEWSDFPFILLTERGGSIERNPAARRYFDLLGNVTFLERPFHPTTLISIAQAALRGRRRQYEARGRLQTIREREEQLRIALSAGKLGAWMLDVATMTLNASSHCKANYGFAPSAPFTYEDLCSTIHIDDRDRMRQAVSQTLETGDDYDIEYRCVWPDGTMHWVQVRGRPERDGNGLPLRMVGVSQDITERKASETTLRNFAAELETRVEQRTREHEAVAAQLHEAQKLETLGQLTGGVAHDFNNLLTPIVGSLDLVRRRIDDPKLQRLIDGALQSSERARILIARLLSFARRQNLEARPVDVRDLVDGMEDLIQRSIGPAISLDVDTGATPAIALIDPNQLELALLNLAVNARDAMPDGGRLTIEVEAEAGTGDLTLPLGSYIRVSVRDTGVGMDATTLARAVEPFYSTKGVGKGTGLGLSMVHGLAAQSGGLLAMSSAPGEGTKAELWLPAAPAAAVVPRASHDEGSRGGEKFRLLLVDDEELVRRGTAQMLGDLGHDVVQAESGATALGLLRSEAFDILVTDYLMPGMSGLELAREARRIYSGLPVLMITGFADLAQDSAAEVARLPKPFRLAELSRAIQDQAKTWPIPAARGHG